jgi:hypothetical protein
LLTPPAEAAASQKWKIIYLQVLSRRGWNQTSFDISSNAQKVPKRTAAFGKNSWIHLFYLLFTIYY